MSDRQPTRIVVLGGGFAGTDAVMELERLLGRDPHVEITLVNKDNFFVFTPMLHEVAASDLDLTHIVNPIRKLLRGAGLDARPRVHQGSRPVSDDPWHADHPPA